MGTFSKSLASLGGFIASDAATIDYLKHNSRASDLQREHEPGQRRRRAGGLEDHAERSPSASQQLWRNTRPHEARAAVAGLRPGRFGNADPAGVLPRPVDRVQDVCKRLEEEGVFVNPVVSPAVRPAQELIRISLMATHTDAQIDFALEKLAKVGKELGLS